MPLLLPSRRRTAALAAVVAGAYGVGMLSGPAAELPTRVQEAPSVLDATAARIAESTGLRAGDLNHASVQAMLDGLDDRWAAYLDPVEYARFEQSIDGHYTGVGVFVRRSPQGQVYVASVQAGSPADKAMVGVGDGIVAVDSRPTATMSVEEASTALRGAAGTDVVIDITHGNDVRSVTMRRVVMPDEDVSVSRLRDGVVKITITSFTRGVGKKVRQAAAQAGGTGVVLDLRGNPGGLLHEAVEVASAFLPDGPVVTFVRRGAQPQDLDAVGDASTSAPVVVLVDGGTASAAEVVAAALQERGRAVVIGSQTFGKGTVQQPMRLADGGGVEFTVGTYLTPLGHSVDGVGITPDISVAGGSSPSVALARATAVLAGLIADAHTAGRG